MPEQNSQSSVDTIKTGLPAKFFKFLDGVLGQLSDGWGENNTRWDPYWRNMKAAVEDGETVVKVKIGCHLKGESNEKIKEFFANNIKKTAKMALGYEDAGEWKRDNENRIWGYFNEYWTAKEAYYAYEVLKGRNTAKHPEYESLFEENEISEDL